MINFLYIFQKIADNYVYLEVMSNLLATYIKLELMLNVNINNRITNHFLNIFYICLGISSPCQLFQLHLQYYRLSFLGLESFAG